MPQATRVRTVLPSMMRHGENALVLDQVLCEAAVSILGSYGVAVEGMRPAPATQLIDHDAVGVIGFVGERARGTLVVATCRTLVAATCPSPAPYGPEVQLRDWLCEITNLILGRVKMGFARHGVDIELCTPVAMTGQRIRMGAQRGATTRSWDIQMAGTPLRLWLDVELDVDFTPEHPAELELAPGEPLFF